MEEIQIWLLLLWEHWLIALVGGSIVTGLFFFAVGLIERLWGWTMPKRWYIITVVFFFILIASFMAWKDTHLKYSEKSNELTILKKRLESPRLGGLLNIIGTAVDGKGRKTVTVSGVITNPYGPPTAITNWKMRAEFPDGRLFYGHFRYPDDTDVKIPIPGENKHLIFSVRDYWTLNSDRPIPVGGSLRGWISFYFNDLDIDDAYKNKATFVLEFSDVVNSRSVHKLSIVLTKRGINIPGFTEWKR